ncbi:E2F-associated phosphoprotein-like [Haliotis rufescens]|uniref:E2F-associated phosphoprotein-like n=1 Tax=Haliotis rufescens TaxID=6454 RepID=UPI00201E8EB2|nr:E2F-associated phosphoprotein-like [Haliotis rufescens]
MYEDEDSDGLDFGGDSEDNGAESSEDELDTLLHALPEVRQRLQYCRQQQKEPEGDDFEREMNEEVQQTVAAIETERKLLSRVEGVSQEATPHCSTTEVTSEEQSEPTKFYDNIYFDSDEEDNEGVSGSKRKHPIPTDDDLLYDPNMDDDDERWVVKQRQKYRPNDQGDQLHGGKKKKNISRSDAVLNCPACMTTLCRDCQRHDHYDNQFRAMFVTSCVVDSNELLKFPEQKGRRKRKKKQDKSTPCETNSSEEDKYNPVKCEECNTVVAMFDKEEVYHFFNVLVSYA